MTELFIDVWVHAARNMSSTLPQAAAGPGGRGHLCSGGEAGGADVQGSAGEGSHSSQVTRSPNLE